MATNPWKQISSHHPSAIQAFAALLPPQVLHSSNTLHDTLPTFALIQWHQLILPIRCELWKCNSLLQQLKQVSSGTGMIWLKTALKCKTAATLMSLSENRWGKKNTACWLLKIKLCCSYEDAEYYRELGKDQNTTALVLQTHRGKHLVLFCREEWPGSEEPLLM